MYLGNQPEDSTESKKNRKYEGDAWDSKNNTRYSSMRVTQRQNRTNVREAIIEVIIVKNFSELRKIQLVLRSK